MVYSRNQTTISLAFCPNPNNFPLLPKGSGNYKDLDKTRVKLFPNFTRHHLITHTNLAVFKKTFDAQQKQVICRFICSR